MSTKKMVLGFAFASFDEVVLISKKRPDWMAGKLNGVGGHIEDRESPFIAMAREFWEETGVTIPPTHWIGFATMYGPGWKVECFAAIDPDVLRVKSRTDEQIGIYLVSEDLTGPGQVPPMIPNLPWLIPMAVDSLQNKHCPYGVNIRYGHKYDEK